MKSHGDSGSLECFSCNSAGSTRADAARAAVRTFRALGGGWDVRSNPSIVAVK
jgi:hypothetical protein